MSVLNWIMDLDQESKLAKQRDLMKEMQARIENLEEWVKYLKERCDKLENDNGRSFDE